MRKRDPKHEKQLKEILSASPEECKRRFAVTDYRNTDYVQSEVVAAVIRARFGQSTGVLDAATAALHRRVLDLIAMRVFSTPHWRVLARNDSEVIVEASQYFWAKMLGDTNLVCNAEVRFAVYLQNRVDDYMRHLLTEENTRMSVDAMTAVDEDGQETNFIATVEDSSGETPEDTLSRGQYSERVMSTLMAMPKHERNAFYFRVECEYDWKKVAELLKCSIPTARAYYQKAMEKLQGVCDE